MLTTGDVQNDLLRCAGIEDPTHADALLTARMVTDLNAALQEVWSRCLPEDRRQEFSTTLRGPVTLSNVTATQYSNTISCGQITDAQAGQSVLLNDDVQVNMLTTGSSVLNQYRGTTTTTGSGTLYNDCIILDGSVVGAGWPVWIDGRFPLTPILTRADARRHLVGWGWCGAWGGVVNLDWFFDGSSGTPALGRPRFYRVEAVNNSGNYTRVYRLRVYPLPDQDYTLRYEPQIGAPSYDGFDDNVVLQLPRGLDESVFLPIVRNRFSSAPQFSEQIDRDALAADYANALLLLTLISPLPQGHARCGTPEGF